MTALNHTINIVITAGVIVFDDRGDQVQTIRLPFATLFFRLPATIYLWLLTLPRKIHQFWGWISAPAKTAVSPKNLILNHTDSPLPNRERGWGRGPIIRQIQADLDLLTQALFTGGPYWRLVYS